MNECIRNLSPCGRTQKAKTESLGNASANPEWPWSLQLDCLFVTATDLFPAGTSCPLALSCPGRPAAPPGGNKPHIQRYAAHTLQQMVGNRGKLLCRHAERRSRNAYGSYRLALRVEHWNRDTTQPLFQLLVVHGVATAASLLNLGAQRVRGSDGSVCESFEPRATNDIGDAIFRQESKDCLAYRSAMHRIARTDAGDHTH